MRLSSYGIDTALAQVLLQISRGEIPRVNFSNYRVNRREKWIRSTSEVVHWSYFFSHLMRVKSRLATPESWKGLPKVNSTPASWKGLPKVLFAIQGCGSRSQSCAACSAGKGESLLDTWRWTVNLRQSERATHDVGEGVQRGLEMKELRDLEDWTIHDVQPQSDKEPTTSCTLQ